MAVPARAADDSRTRAELLLAAAHLPPKAYNITLRERPMTDKTQSRAVLAGTNLMDDRCPRSAQVLIRR